MCVGGGGGYFFVAVGDIHIERTVSQNFDLCLSFCFMSKNGNLLIIFLIFFLKIS